MILDKDAFVGIHELDGIRCRIMFVFPNLKLFAWRLDEPGWAVFALPGAATSGSAPGSAPLSSRGLWPPYRFSSAH